MLFTPRNEHAMNNNRRRAGAVALLACAAVVLPATPALAAWEQAELHAVDVQRVCQDGVQLQLAWIDFGGDAPPPDPVTAHLVVADPPPVEPVVVDPGGEPPTRYPLAKGAVVFNRTLVLPELRSPRKVVTGDQQELLVSHLRKGTYRFSRKIPVGTTVGISAADFATSSAVLRRPVERCRLFG